MNMRIFIGFERQLIFIFSPEFFGKVSFDGIKPVDEDAAVQVTIFVKQRHSLKFKSLFFEPLAVHVLRADFDVGIGRNITINAGDGEAAFIPDAGIVLEQDFGISRKEQTTAVPPAETKVDPAAFSFAMAIHAIIEYEFDLEQSGMKASHDLMCEYIDEFCRVYAAKGE